MAETTETNINEFTGKDCVFVADWLKTKGLHKLCSVFEGVSRSATAALQTWLIKSKAIIRRSLMKTTRHPTRRNATAETKTFALLTVRALPRTLSTKQLSQQLLVTHRTTFV